MCIINISLLLFQVKIGGNNNPHRTAVLELDSYNKGFLPPRLTSTEIRAIYEPAEGLIVYNTTHKLPFFFNGDFWISFDSSISLVEIGDYFQGGVVFYLEEGNAHGLILSIDQIGNEEFGCANMSIAGANGLEFGDGAQNTIDILNSCGQLQIAAEICDEYVYDGYNDWFLPTAKSLLVLKGNLPLLNQKIMEQQGDIIRNSDIFWSSYQTSPSTAFAVSMDPGASQPVESVLKSRSNEVRAVRRF